MNLKIGICSYEYILFHEFLLSLQIFFAGIRAQLIIMSIL